MLSIQAVRRLIIAMTDAGTGNEVASAINSSEALVSQSNLSVPAAIVATNVSTTIDFAALAVGDIVIHIPAVAGNADFGTIATAGTLYEAAVVGDLYVALRAYSAPAAADVVL